MSGLKSVLKSVSWPFASKLLFIIFLRKHDALLILGELSAINVFVAQGKYIFMDVKLPVFFCIVDFLSDIYHYHHLPKFKASLEPHKVG